MKIEKEFLEDHQVKLHVEFEPEQFEQAKRRAAKKIAKKVKIPGFRPGKAPYNVIVRHVGEGTIIEDATEMFVDEMYPKVLEEAEIKPYGPGTLEDVETLEPPTFVFKVPLAPEVELGDYKSLEIPYEPPEITDEAVDARLEEMRQDLALTETSTEPAQEGDRVYFQVSAERVEPEKGEDATLIAERFNSVVIEPDNENEWPFPGFSANLIGMSAEESKDIIYTYPDDYEDEALRGVEAIFHVTVTNVQKVTLPALDDEFAKSASDFDTLEELRADIRKNLEETNQHEYDEQYNEQVLDALVEKSVIKYPPQMLEAETKEMISDLEYRLSQQGIDLELYKQIRGIDDEGIREETTPFAENRLKRGLVLAEVAENENLQIDEQQLEIRSGQILQYITRDMNRKELAKFQKSAYVSSLVGSIYTDMMTEKTIQYLRAIAKGDPIPGEEDEETDTAPEAVEDTPEAESSPEAEAAPEGGEADAEPEEAPETPESAPAPEEPEADPAPEDAQSDEEAE